MIMKLVKIFIVLKGQGKIHLGFKTSDSWFELKTSATFLSVQPNCSQLRILTSTWNTFHWFQLKTQPSTIQAKHETVSSEIDFVLFLNGEVEASGTTVAWQVFPFCQLGQ